MPFDEAFEKASAYPDFVSLWGQFLFYRNKWGNAVVVYISPITDVVTKTRCYASLWTSSTPAAFHAIKEGMTVYEVTATVGLPFGLKTSGMTSLDYYDSLGNKHRIYFSSERESDNWVVDGYRFYERNPDK